MKDQLFIDADSEDWSDWEDAQLVWVFAGRTCNIVVFYHVAAHFRSYFCQTPNIPLHIWKLLSCKIHTLEKGNPLDFKTMYV